MEIGKTFNLDGNARADGLIRFTCDELPGFRLLVASDLDEASYEGPLKEALRAFVPLYIAAVARNQDIGIKRRDRGQDGTEKRRIELVASFTA